MKFSAVGFSLLVALVMDCAWAQDAAVPQVKLPGHNPIASTGVMSRKVGGRTADLSGSVVGAKKLYLTVIPSEKYAMDNPAAWLEPRLVGPAGMKRLTELTPVAVANAGGALAVNKTMAGRDLRHLGQAVEYGFGVRALSVLEFDLPEGYAQFLTTVSIDSMNPQDQDVKASVRFKVFTDLPGEASAFPELDAKEKAKLDAEKEKLQQKGKQDLIEARKKVQRSEERMKREQEKFNEEKKKFEELQKKYPDVKLE
jgi:hypothetical protein